MKSDIEIARSVELKKIKQVAEGIGIPREEVENYGRYIAKIPEQLIDEEKVKKSNLVLVTAITATKAGIGKTTVSIGLALGLNKIGKKAIVALREPSLGPCFGMKGGAAGGGYAQVLPMEKINLYTRRAYKPEEVYTFSVVLCDNEVDRDGECFTKETLEELAKLFVGKTGILDHEPTSKNQTARVFGAAVKEIPGKVTSLNEPYAQLTARAYVPRNDGTKAFIESIESGIRKEVSVGCAVKKRVCSVCGAESCVHVPGKTYNGKRCVRILSGAADAYEFSFVAVPAQRAAGVVKKFSPRFEESEKKKEVKTVYDIVKKLADGEDSVTVAKEELNMLKTELKALFDRAECGDRYRAALCERIYKLSAVAQPEFKRGLTEAITKLLGIAELEEMAAALAKAAERKMPVMPQLAAEKTEDTNAADDGAFRI